MPEGVIKISSSEIRNEILPSAAANIFRLCKRSQISTISLAILCAFRLVIHNTYNVGFNEGKALMKLLTDEARFEHEMVESYNDGECIFAEGDVGRDLYIVQSGEVKILKKVQSETVELATFTKGDFFGDMALLQSLPRYAAAHASGETRLLILKPAGFLLKIRRDPTFAFEMLQQMSLRVKVSNDRVIELVEKFKLPRDEVQKLLLTLNGKS